MRSGSCWLHWGSTPAFSSSVRLWAISTAWLMSLASLLILSDLTNTMIQILAQIMKKPTTTSISIKNGPEPDPLFLFIRLKSSAS